MPRINSVKQRQLTAAAPDQSKERVVARLGSLPVATYSTAVSSTSLIGIDQPLTVTVTTSNVSDGTTLNWAMIGDSRDSFDPITASVTVSGDEAVISTTTVSNPAAGSVSMAIAKTGGTVVAVTEVISVSISAVSPANTSPPSISGTQIIGSVLTCSPGTWTGVPSPTFTYQWRRNSLAISGSTDSTYTIVDQDFDTQISCAVTAANTAGSATEVSNSTSAIPASAPVNTALPTISGSAAVGVTLTCSTGTWTGAPSPTFTYQWQRDTVDISDATDSTYTIVSADVGNTLRCVVTATNSAAAVSATSQSTATVSPTYSVSPAADNVDEGSSLLFTVTTAGVDNNTTLYWTVTNAGDFATASGSFTITDNSGSFSVTPTADNTPEGPETFQAQIRTGSISGDIVTISDLITINDTSIGVAPSNTVLPAISGTVASGETLTCSTGTWTGTPTPSYAFQWQRGSTNISGATISTYTVTNSDIGSTLRCVVTATNTAGSVSATSSSTITVPDLQESSYTTPGTYTWIAPSGVTSVSVLAIGGGGGAGDGDGFGGGGAGGNLRYVNNIAVTPGASYTVVVGAGGIRGGNFGNRLGTAGGLSSFNGSTVVAQGGGAGGTSGGQPTTSGNVGTGGNGGGSPGSTDGGGGGAGGYSGNGGTGGNGFNATQPTAGSGGGGGGGGSGSGAGGGGGVGIFGAGSNGAAGTGRAIQVSGIRAGGGGSSGLGGGSSTTTGATGIYGGTYQNGGLYGGGGGGGYGGGNGSVGAVRIIWPGNTRQFPSTNAGNV